MKTVAACLLLLVVGCGESASAPYVKPPSGLVGYWKFDELAAGDVAADASDFGVSGPYSPVKPVVSSNAAPVKFSNPASLRFDGKGSHVLIPVSPHLAWTSGDAYTLMAWVNPAALTSTWQAIISNAPPGPSSCGIYISDKNQWSYEAISATGAFAPATLGWHHVAIVQDPTTTSHTIYVDGVASPNVRRETLDCMSTNAFQIGAADGDAFGGEIDEVRIYGGALSAAEIMTLASGQELTP